MKDWDVPLDFAVEAAAQAAQKPLLCELLKIAGEGKELPLALPAEGMARLLDIAILTGDREAAAYISKKCQVWPLRRWRGRDFVDTKFCARILLAALWAGADFQSIHVPHFDFTLRETIAIPLQAHIFLCRSEDWQDYAEFFKPAAGAEWRPTSTDNEMVGCFSGLAKWPLLSVDRIQGAPKAGIDIRKVRGAWGLRDTLHCSGSLLGLAILYGQQDCAVACARLGLQQSGFELNRDANSVLRDYLHSEASSDHPLLDDDLVRILKPSASECRSAAVAAGQTALRASWQREAAQNGVAVFQVMRKMLRSFPLALVGDILTFSMEVPEFVEKLDLWKFGDGWMTLVPPNSDSHLEKVHGINEPNDPRAREHETGTGSASAAAAPDSAPEALDVNGKSTDELMEALRASRDQVPVLNMDGVCVFRLTSMATSCHVNELLLDATGPLAALHARVLNAGCEVNPEWNVMKALFVPVTEAQMAELQGLAEHGYELNKTDHILALQADQQVIEGALKGLRWKNRPKLKKAGPEMAPPTADMEDMEEPMLREEDTGPLLVLEQPFRTDSDVGFPIFEW